MKKELSPIEKVALCGYLLTNDIDSSYKCIHKDSKASIEIQHRMALRWLRDPKCTAFLSQQRTLLEKKAREELERAIKENPHGKDLTDKGNVIQELQILYSAETNAKVKADILMKIADLERMKQETPKEQEELVHFYLPRPECEGCPFSKEEKEK